LFTILVVGMLFFPRAPQEPFYEGKSLSDWLLSGELSAQRARVAYMQGLNQTAQEPSPVAQKALNQIGTNAFPIMLRWISANHLPYWYKNLLSRLPLSLRNRLETPGKAVTQAQLAVIGFNFYGERAAPVVPRLLKMADQRRTESMNYQSENPSLMALEGMRHAIFPELWAGFTNGSPTACYLVVRTMEERIQLPGGMKGNEAILEQLVAYKDQQVALNAIRILLNKEAIPILTPCLDDKRPAVRVAAIFALANFERTLQAWPARSGLTWTIRILK